MKISLVLLLLVAGTPGYAQSPGMFTTTGKLSTDGLSTPLPCSRRAKVLIAD
jgi:hypothetical protein